LLGVLTIGLLAAATELIARLKFAEWATRADGCMVKTDPSRGWVGIPNCAVREKTYEGEPVEVRFNSSGYHADADFGPKRPDTYRIVLVGSSFAFAGEVKMEDSFGALIPAELSHRTGRKVELYNEAIVGWGGTPRNIASRFDKALSAQPDMVLWVLTSWDIRNASGNYPTDEILPDESRLYPADRGSVASAGVSAATASPQKVGLRAKVWSIVHSIRSAVAEAWRNSRTNTMVTHFIDEYGGPRQYLDRSGIWHNDAQYFGATPGKARLRHLKEFDGYAAQIEAQAVAAQVPLVVVFMPNRAHAALISVGNWPADIDPFSLDNELRAIVERHRGIYIDILPGYRGIPHAEKGYFPVDGHPNRDGYATISELLVQALTSGAVPGLTVDAAARPASGQ